MTILVPQDARRANLVWSEEIGELVLIHSLGQVGNVEVSVAFVRECLELGVERLLSKASVLNPSDSMLRRKRTLAKLTS